jgi:hypothetical protein
LFDIPDGLSQGEISVLFVVASGIVGHMGEGGIDADNGDGWAALVVGDCAVCVRRVSVAAMRWRSLVGGWDDGAKRALGKDG